MPSSACKKKQDPLLAILLAPARTRSPPPGGYWRCSLLLDSSFFCFNDTATTEIYTLSLHDALPISAAPPPPRSRAAPTGRRRIPARPSPAPRRRRRATRSEEHTSELQSLTNLVCRLLLEKKNNSSFSPTVNTKCNT